MEGRVLFDKYELVKLLGKGNFGKVYKAKNIVTSEIVAIKLIDKAEMRRQRMEGQVEKEIMVMSLVKHPNIVELKEVMASKTTIYLVMEYVGGGHLYAKILLGGKLEEDLARKLFQQLITAVDFCHSRGVCHRDLKLDNVLIDSCGENLKVADFGLATTLPGADEREGGYDGLLYDPCGALAFMAPEIIRGRGYDGRESDIWSCGVILFALVAGYLPFQDKNKMRMVVKINSGKYDFPLGLGEEIKGLIQKILKPKPSERITMYDIMNTPWFKTKYSHPFELCDPQDEGGLICSFSSFSYNAFDLIRLMGSGLDLSALFEKRKRRIGTVFVSSCGTPVIVRKVEEMGRSWNYMVLKDKEMMRVVLRGKGMGRMGRLVISVQVFEVSPGVKVVEFLRWSGDRIEYMKMMEEKVRPAMESVVWKWQGDWISSGRSCGECVKLCCFGLVD